MTRWTPDTCNNPPCIFEYTDDGNFTLTNVVQKCSRHSSQTNSVAYTNVKGENQNKNIAHQLILDNGPTALFDTVNGSRVLKNSITVSWVYSGTPPDTTLTLTYTGITLTNQQKNSIQTFLNNRFGTNKVVLA